jgi:hypothetical protein
VLPIAAATTSESILGGRALNRKGVARKHDAAGDQSSVQPVLFQSSAHPPVSSTAEINRL